MKLIRVLILCFFITSCSNDKKPVQDYKKLDYKDLNIFISDSLPSLLEFDQNHTSTFNLWKDISLINSVKNISMSDPRQLNFTLSALKNDIIKINDINLPVILNHPQIIGRFRVLKTDILKIDINDLSIENYKIFQNHLKDIIVSYNAFVNIMNLEVAKDKNEEFLID
ncbi:hypothetical protein N9O97_01955 [Flavobacteriaceae bacterium]|nr:hypothetical protein [Flavobacteriaceae bacterium]